MGKIEVLDPVQIGGTDISYAQGIKAGNWVFLTGHEATDFQTGLAPEAIGKPGLPWHGLPRHRREGDFILERFKNLLAEAGTDFAHAVRLDQYYPTWKAVDPYHLSRKAYFGSYIPPSTSVLMSELLVRDAAIDASLLAVLPGDGRDVEQVYPRDVAAPTWSGFVPAVKSGDFIFVAGQMASSGDGALDPRAHVPPHFLWGGYEIRRQADFVIGQRLAPALEAAGSSFGNAVKAQAYLRHAEDIPHFLDVWTGYFGSKTCALTVVPTAGFGLVDGIIEINLLALADDGKTKKQVIDTKIPDAMAYGAPAVRAGDLLLLSGLMAVNDEGAVSGVVAGAGLAHFRAGVWAQMEYLLEQSEAICRAGGTTLGNVVRVHQFQTDLADFAATQRAWQAVLPGQPIPYSAVGVPALPAPDCTVMLDLWIYAPPA